MKYNPYDSRSFENIKFDPTPDAKDWKREKFLKYDLPATIGIAVASLPFVGSEKMKKSFYELRKLSNLIETIGNASMYFTINTWIFDDKKHIKVCESLNEVD